MIDIKVKELTEDNFSKYGALIDLKKTRDKPSESPMNYWPLYNITFELPHLGILEIERDGFPISVLEKHIIIEEVFIPVSGIGIMPFALPNVIKHVDKQSKINEIEAFLIDGSKALIINRGIWHYPPQPLSKSIRFLMALTREYASDTCKMPIDAFNFTF